MKQKNTLRLLVGAALVSSLFSVQALAADKEPIRIGAVSSISGVFAQQGEEVLRGIEFAVEQANQNGGIDGREVLIKKADDESTPDAGRRAAEKLSREGYNLLIGPIASSITMAVGQSLDRWDAMQVVVVSKTDRITGDACKPRMFRTNHSDAMDLSMIDQWMDSVPEKRFAVVGADYVWGRDSADHFKRSAEANGKEVALSVFPPLGTKDFAPYISQINGDPTIDGVWVALVGRDLIAFAKQAQEFGLTKKRILGHAYIMNFVVNATDNATEGVWGNSGYGADINTPENKAFVEAWQAKYNRLPTDNEGQAYNGVQAIFEGVKLANSVAPKDISTALRGASFPSIYGGVTMRAEDNQLLLPNYISQVVKQEDGSLRPVIQHVFDATLIPAPSPECKL